MKLKMPIRNFTWKHGLVLALAAALVYCLIYSCQFNVNALNKDVQLSIDNTTADQSGKTLSAGADVSVGLPQLGGDSGSPTGYAQSMNYGTL